MSAYYALEAGADAIYLGLKKFSARKTAQNFSVTELSKIKRIARERGKKVYVAFNTVVKEDEIEGLASDMIECDRLDIDGIIIQDFGALSMARKHFPGARIHASTQMAIHNHKGIEAALDLGIKRIILPRELELESIRKLKRDFPSAEFEVFIHGALCYSYSGLCLASGLLTKRSGNRGECSQVCRLEYTLRGRPGHYLSCKDLFLGREVNRLKEAGIDALKIEGRLKPPEYVYNAVRLYRYAIDNPEKCDSEEYTRLLADSGFAFSRERTRGRVLGGKGERVITEKYARSVGCAIGVAGVRTETGFAFKTRAQIAINDVLQFYLNNNEKLPFKLPVRGIRIAGNRVNIAPAGSLVSIESEIAPDPGQEISKVYSKTLELKGVRHKRFPEHRRNMEVAVLLSHNGHETIRIESADERNPFVFSHRIIFSGERRRSVALESISLVFGEDDDSQYKISITEVRNETGIDSSEIFIPLKLLRKIKRELVLHLGELDIISRDKAASLIAGGIRVRPESENGIRDNTLDLCEIRDFISKRENLSPHGDRVPFYTEGPLHEKTATFGNSCFIPLAPVVEDEYSYYVEIERFIKNNPRKRVFLGINNIHHVKVVRSLVLYGNVHSFVDFFFYIANRFSVFTIEDMGLKASFGYFWIEGGMEDYLSLKSKIGFPIIKIGQSFSPPYFMHSGKFLPDDCTEGGSFDEKGFELIYREHIFNAINHEGFTYIFYESRD